MRNNFYLDIIKKLISHLVIFLTNKYVIKDNNFLKNDKIFFFIFLILISKFNF